MSYITFYMVWNIVQHNLIHLVANIVYYIYYRYEFPFIERYKTNFEEPWPWHENPQEWRKIVKKSILVFIINSNFIPLLVIIPFSQTSAWKEHTLDVDDLPTPITLALTVFFCMICEDAFFYWAHRLLHLPIIYPHIHKIHHQYT